MLIARYEYRGAIDLGIVEDGRLWPTTSGGLRDHPLFDRLGAALPAHLDIPDEELKRASEAIDLTQVRLLTPVPRPGKIVCIGVNYRAHIEESGFQPPPFPEVFAKFDNALNDPDAPIPVNALDPATDYEGELCVVFGQTAKGLTRTEALDAIAGYTVANDVSARTWQLRISQWNTGKSFDGFCPVGPWLATRTSIPDPQDLGLRTEVNGEIVQDSNTKRMIFGVADLVTYLSSVMTFHAGDLLLTGTPEGVGFHRKPQLFLKAGDKVAVTIDRIGTLMNPVSGP